MENRTSRSQKSTVPKFGIRDCLAYAAGDFGCNMSFALKGTLQTFWLIYMTLETGYLSVLLLLVQIWDAVNDPLIGSIIDSDRKHYRRGKFKTYILAGAIGLSVAGALCFVPLPQANLAVKTLIFISGYVIWDACYTVANVPYGSMLSLITEDAAERSLLSTWRSVGSMLGNLVPSILLPMLIWKKERDESGSVIINPDTGVAVETFLGERVFAIALFMGILGFASFLFMLGNIHLRGSENAAKVNDSARYNLFSAFKNFFQNRAALGATLAAMGMFLGMNSASTATQIMFAIYFGKANLSGIVGVIGFIPMLFFMPFIKKIVNRWGKKEASSVGAAVSVLGGILMLYFPRMENKTSALILYVISLGIYGIGMGIYTCVSWALMADAVDYNEWKTSLREEGTVYSLHSFFRKLSQGIGPSAILLIMGLLGYNSKLGIDGQSAATAKNMCYLVAWLYLFSAVVMFVSLAFIYNLDRKKLNLISKDLRKRKEKAA